MYNSTACISLIIVIVTVAFSCSPESKGDQHKPSQAHYALQSSIAWPAWYNPSEMDTLTIVTWNIEHFVDTLDNPYIDNRRESEPPEDIKQRHEQLAKALRVINADVVVFQELESDSFLRKFAEDNLPDMNYQIFAALESPDWYMNVVMMSRIPMGMFYSYAHINTPIPGQTDDEGNPASQTFINNRMWTADLLVNEHYRLTITGAHLKAGRGERNRAWRMGQIALLRNHLNGLMIHNPTRNMIVMGDLNTTPASPEFKKLLGEATPKFIDPLANTNIYTHPSDSTFWRIDHILLNRQAKNELIPESVEVIWPLPKEQMIQISDHLPLKANMVAIDH